jgi:hypothetical protein
MRKKINIILILIITNINLYGQKQISGIVFDSKKSNALDYVNIGIFSKNKGTVSSEFGKFILNITDNELKDSLTFSMIGYKTKKVPINFFNLNDTLYLEEEVINLEEIVLRNKKGKIKIIGNKKPKLLLASVKFKNIEAGNELSIKVKVNKNTEITKFNLLLIKNDYKNLKLRVNFYNIKDKKPYERINSQNIILETSLEKGILSLDLNEYNIILKDDFFVSVESLNKLNNVNKEIVIGGRVGGKSYVRKTSQASWVRIKVGFCIFLDTMQY